MRQLPDEGRAIVEANFAAITGQLQAAPEGGSRLIADSREILASTTQLVGSKLGEIEVDTYIALCTKYAEAGMPANLTGETSKWALAKAVYGTTNLGGMNYAQITKALYALWRMEITITDLRPAQGGVQHVSVELERLIRRVRFDDWVTLRDSGPEQVFDPRKWGATRDGTISWVFEDWLGRQLRQGAWVELDWDKLRSLNGVAKVLWLTLLSPRVPFARATGSPGLECVRLMLDPRAYAALGIKNKAERGARRTLLAAAERVTSVDPGTFPGMELQPSVSHPGQQDLVVYRRETQEQLAFSATAA